MSEMKTIVKNGTVVSSSELCHTDILIEGATIAELGNFQDLPADAIFDAEGLLVFPGAIDTHVHFNDEFMSTISVHNYYRGTLAAAYGGVTSIVDFSNQLPGEPLLETVHRKKEEAADLALIDWGVHPVITQYDDQLEQGIIAVVAAGAPTIKCYMTYRQEGLLIEPNQLKHILSLLKKHNGMLMVHAEDNDPIESNIADFVAAGKGAPIFHALSRPVETEATAIDACLTLAQETGGRLFIVHMSSADRMEQIALARDAGCSIFAETCTHYLIFTEEMLQRDDGIKWICSPPLRKRATQERLWQGLQEGQVMMVTSDDAAFSWKAKLLGQDRFDKCPNGIPGIEPRFSLLYSEGVAKNRITVNKFVELIAETPAILFGLDTHKGSIKPGLDADIVLFDPNEEWIMKHDTLHMAADWSAYDNIPINGKIKQVFSRGELLIDGEKCLAEKGRGKYLHRVLQT